MHNQSTLSINSWRVGSFLFWVSSMLPSSLWIEGGEVFIWIGGLIYSSIRIEEAEVFFFTERAASDSIAI